MGGRVPAFDTQPIMPITDRPSRPADLTSSPGRTSRSPGLALLTCALVVALALLSLYVQVLHDAIERGEQLREDQRQSVPGAFSSTRVKSGG